MILRVLSLPPSSARQAILLCNQATMLNKPVAGEEGGDGLICKILSLTFTDNHMQEDFQNFLPS